MSDLASLERAMLVMTLVIGWYLGVLTETYRAGKRCPHCERKLRNE